MRNLILTILGLLLTSSIYAQDYSRVKYNLDTPFTGIFTEKRFTGDRKEAKYYNGKGEETNSAILEYRRSKDGLRDTVFTHSGASRIDEYIYSEDNKLIGWKPLFFDRENDDELVDLGFLTEYAYDSEGRIASVCLISTDTDEKVDSVAYNYTDHTITHYYFMDNDELETGEFIQIEYTDSGYICRDTTFHHITIAGKDTSYIKYREDEYIFDQENRLKRIRGIVGQGVFEIYEEEYDTNISYTDDSYTISYGDHRKEEYFLNDKEDITFILSYQRKTGEWELSERSELTYVYSDPQSNTSVLDRTQPVYGIEGGIVVATEIINPVYIYTISGQFVKKIKAQPNQSIPLSKGLYIVTVNNQSYKVKVK